LTYHRRTGDERMSMAVIDTHLHFWNLEQVEYPWLSDVYGPLFRTYELDEVEPQLRGCGIDAAVLVQSANSYEDTQGMLAAARTYAFVAGVVGWVPLTDPDEAASGLDRLAADPLFRGVRHLIHEEPDPDWLLQETVLESLKLLAERQFTFDVVAVLPRHLEHVPVLAENAPELKIVIDHLAKPPIKDGGWEPWATLLARAAEFPNVYAKVSGLNTAADLENWTANDLEPYIAFAVEQFGADRLMFGGDWPVVILAGDYEKVWRETNKALRDLATDERDAILGGTAAAFYGLGL
jgi:L-fuconolactonase